jgi:hypothetical protein
LVYLSQNQVRTFAWFEMSADVGDFPVSILSCLSRALEVEGLGGGYRIELFQLNGSTDANLRVQWKSRSFALLRMTMFWGEAERMGSPSRHVRRNLAIALRERTESDCPQSLMVGGSVGAAVTSATRVGFEDQEGRDEEHDDAKHYEDEDATAALRAFTVRLRIVHGRWMLFELPVEAAGSG